MLFYNIRRWKRREAFYSKKNLIKHFFCLPHGGGLVLQIFGQIRQGRIYGGQWYILPPSEGVSGGGIAPPPEIQKKEKFLLWGPF